MVACTNPAAVHVALGKRSVRRSKDRMVKWCKLIDSRCAYAAWIPQPCLEASFVSASAETLRSTHHKQHSGAESRWLTSFGWSFQLARAGSSGVSHHTTYGPGGMTTPWLRWTMHAPPHSLTPTLGPDSSRTHSVDASHHNTHSLCSHSIRHQLLLPCVARLNGRQAGAWRSQRAVQSRRSCSLNEPLTRIAHQTTESCTQPWQTPAHNVHIQSRRVASTYRTSMHQATIHMLSTSVMDGCGCDVTCTQALKENLSRDKSV
ncbi:hypothetical protein L1887_48990 [Cichorium endivia]|nr:hypothetical protein L1887_48990 [Cichorium endivia]